MGFSVSGSAAIVFAALFIAFGTWHGATTDSFERVTDAREDRADRALAEDNTEIDVVRAFHGSDTLEIEVTNNGSTTLSMNATDVFVDNEYKTGWEGRADIDGSSVNSDLWQPGETLSVTFSYGVAPARVKVVTENGVSATMEVTD